MPVHSPSACPIRREWSAGFATRKSYILRRLSSSRPSVIRSPQQGEVQRDEDREVQREPFRTDGRDGHRRHLDEQPEPFDEEDAERTGQEQEASLAVTHVRLHGDGRQDRGEPSERNPEEHVQRAHLARNDGSSVRYFAYAGRRRVSEATEGRFEVRPNEFPVWTKIPLSGKRH